MPPKRNVGPKDWGHGDGLPLGEVDLSAEHTGTITNIIPAGVFVDFGAVKDGFIQMRGATRFGYKRGMELSGLTVKECDLEKSLVLLESMELDQQPELQGSGSMPPRGPPREQPSRRGQSSIANKPRSATPNRRQQRTWDHLGATPLEDLEIGQTVDGRVTNVSPYGVFVDVGAERDARLSIPTRYGRRFRIGDSVYDIRLDEIDVAGQRITATIEDPDLATRELPPKPRGKAKASPAPKRASSKPRQDSTTLGQNSGTTVYLEDLEIGSMVSGVVANNNQYGVFVDISCGKDALLKVPGRFRNQLQIGHEIIDMRVDDVDLERNTVKLSMDDPETSINGAGGSMNPVPRTSTRMSKAMAKPTSKATARPGPWPQTSPQQGPSPKPATKPRGGPQVPHRVGDIVDGSVTRLGADCAYLDIGLPPNSAQAILRLDQSILQEFRLGDAVNGMTVESIDRRQVVLSLEDPELEDSEPFPAANRFEEDDDESDVSMQGSRSLPLSHPKSRQNMTVMFDSEENPDWSHTDGPNLDEIEVGIEVSGVVMSSSRVGVFVDFGADRNGRLLLQANEWRKYEVGNEIDRIIVDHVDAQKGLVTLALPDDIGVQGSRQAPMQARNGGVQRTLPASPRQPMNALPAPKRRPNQRAPESTNRQGVSGGRSSNSR